MLDSPQKIIRPTWFDMIGRKLRFFKRVVRTSLIRFYGRTYVGNVSSLK